jgi:hypothetical protein
MSQQHLRTLQLDTNKVEIAADFFEAYASYQLSQRDTDKDRLADTDKDRLADTASSLRVAGQWAMLFDLPRAVTLLTRSAEIWHAMGYGFGTFLLAAIAPDRLDRDEMLIRLAQMAGLNAPIGEAREPSIQGRQPLEPLLHPQQQAYLLLAAAGVSRRIDLPLGLLRRVGDQSPHRRGVMPIGALGMPLRVYWDIARDLLQIDGDDERTADMVANTLADMGRSYAQAIGSAMANERLWFNAASPVDVGDIDTVAIALNSAHRLGPGLIKAHLRSVSENLEAIARVPLELASEMIDMNPPVANDNQ